MKLWQLYAILVTLSQRSSALTMYKLMMERRAQVVSLSLEEQMQKIREHRYLCYKRIVTEPPTDASRCNMTWDDVLCWDSAPAGTVARQQCPDYVNRFNKAAFATRTCLANGTWKGNLAVNRTEGWTNYSQCLAGVTAPPDVTQHMSRIQLMSEICYGISLAALIIAVLIMVLSKRLHCTSNILYINLFVLFILRAYISILQNIQLRLHCKSNSLHINLFLAFILRASISFLKNILFVDGVGLAKDVEQNETTGGMPQFKQDINHWECKLLVTVFVYSVAASMMWIFMEGLYLHMLVYRTLFTERQGVKTYFLIGWFAPLLYIVPWVFVRIYLDDELCWNTYKEDRYVWIIKGPIICTVLANFVFYIDIVRVLCVRVTLHRHPTGSSKHIRKIGKFAFVLIPLFGVIYIGFAAYPQGLSVNADMVYLYCEMFYNSIQGFILALLFCFLNEEVHNEIRRYWYRKRFTGFGTRSTFLSSWRKNSNVSRGTMSTAANLNERLTVTEGDAAPGKLSPGKPRPVYMNYHRGSYNGKDECRGGGCGEQNDQAGCELYLMSSNNNDHV